MTRPSDELLMRYYDGELPPGEAAEVERALAEHPEALAIVDGLAQLGDVVRALGDGRAGSADAIADDVMARLDATPPLAAVPRAATASRWTLPAVGVTLAAAAAAALWLSREPLPEPLVAQAPTAQPAPLAPPAPPPEPVFAPEEDTLPAVAIEAVDFGTHNGAIFMVSAGQDATPVVWLTDDAESGDGKKPL